MLLTLIHPLQDYFVLSNKISSELIYIKYQELLNLSEFLTIDFFLNIIKK